MDDPKSRDNTIVWFTNEHGIVNCMPAFRVKKLFALNREWDYCPEPDNIPLHKAYPMTGGQLTEQGERNRRAANKQSEALNEDPSAMGATEPRWDKVRKLAKEKGIKSFGRKKKDLMAELGLT